MNQTNGSSGEHSSPKSVEVVDSKLHEFSISGIPGTISIGLDRDKKPCKIAISLDAEGMNVPRYLDIIAEAINMLLEEGVPLERIVARLTTDQRDIWPCGSTNDPQIKSAHSVIDYTCRVLAREYVQHFNGKHE